MRKTNTKNLVLLAVCFSVCIIIGGAGLFAATKTLGISSVLAANLYYALQVIGWGMTAASIVASFGLSTVLTGAILRAVSRYGFKGFVAW